MNLRKEIIIIIILTVVIIFTMFLVFYECFATNVDNLLTVEKEENKTLEDTIKEIEGNNENSEDVLKSYSLTEDDLNAEEETFDNGKKNPFGSYSSTVENEVVSTTTITKEETNKIANEISNQVITNEIKASQENTLVNETKTTVVTTTKDNSSGTYTESKSSK